VLAEIRGMLHFMKHAGLLRKLFLGSCAGAKEQDNSNGLTFGLPAIGSSEVFHRRATIAEATAGQATGAAALGALAIGGLALGFLAIGRLLIREMRVQQVHLRHLKIDQLEVADLRVNKLTVLHERRSEDGQDRPAPGQG
jgi:hypothetical protein